MIPRVEYLPPRTVTRTIQPCRGATPCGQNLLSKTCCVPLSVLHAALADEDVSKVERITAGNSFQSTRCTARMHSVDQGSGKPDSTTAAHTSHASRIGKLIRHLFRRHSYLPYKLPCSESYPCP